MPDNRSFMLNLSQFALVVTLIAPASAFAVCQLPSQRPYQEYAKPSGIYRTQDAVSYIRDQMGDDVMGYAVAFQDRHGQLLAAVNKGWARSPCAPEGEQAFSMNTQAPWGSVTKLITATAVMRKVQKNPTRRTLDDPIIDYLPPAWRDEVSEPYSEITIGNLIQHRGGFDNTAPMVNNVKLSARERLAQDPPERNVAGNRHYSNMSYKLFDYMPKFLRRKVQISEPSSRLTDEEYDADHLEQGARSNEKHFRDQIFTRIGVKMSCNHAEHAGSNFARNYGGPNSSRAGYRVNRADEPGCSVGGLIISPAGMLKFLHQVANSETIVSRETWELMARPGKQRYGWPQTPDVRRDTSLGGERNHGLAFGHNGSRWGGKARGQIYVFPNGMTAVAVVNSKTSGNAPGLSDLLLGAYDRLIP